MLLKIDQLAFLFNKYQENIEIKYFEDIVVRGNCFLPNDIILPDHLRLLAENRIEEIEVVYDSMLYECLINEYPVDYRRPGGKLTFFEMDRYLEQLEEISSQSKRKRFIYIIGDVYGLDFKAGKRIIHLHHNEELDYRKWNIIKREIDKSHIFYYRFSESKIIIFVDMSQTDSNYVEKFKKNADLISLLVSKMPDSSIVLSPDFLPTEDVLSVTDPRNLLNEYIKTNARLIVIGEQLNDMYKTALINVRRYDKFVRMMVVPSIDYRNLNHFFKQIKLVYNSERWRE
ncbi:MAG: hypothetical protein MUD12_08735 [Spirochaetes bacterium]|jgi:hypothetical protein|nr:hypothetical protein [Spirochaetota bacterium]